MNYKKIIFDLDGTLINSATSILCSLKSSFDAAAVRPRKSLNDRLIGPPLQQIIEQLLGKEQIDQMPEIIENFKAHYDSIGYREAIPYPGVTDMLRLLRIHNIDLYIATNKRLTPSLQIVNNLEWGCYFKEVYSLDFFNPVISDKRILLSRICDDFKVNTTEVLYIGDRPEDADAAKYNSMPFLYASWGYGHEPDSFCKLGILNTPNDIFKYL